jgi:hypothetical protein
MFTPKNYLWLNPIIAGLSVIKIIDPTLFRSALKGDVTLDEIKQILAFNKWPSDSTGSAFAIEWWTYCLAKNETDYPDLNWGRFSQSLFQYSIDDRQSIVRLMAGHIDRLQMPQRG